MRLMATIRKATQIHLDIVNRGLIKDNKKIDHEDLEANQIRIVEADRSHATSLERDKTGTQGDRRSYPK